MEIMVPFNSIQKQFHATTQGKIVQFAVKYHSPDCIVIVYFKSLHFVAFIAALRE
jgi:hypothetical protein